MAIDVYSPCPGGTGKKIKFCCPELVGDLNEIDRMVEGNQLVAAGDHLDGLLAEHPDKACLLAVKIQLLHATERYEEARAVIARFAECYPENPIALAESAMLTAAEGDAQAGLTKLLRALALVDGNFYRQVFDAVRMLARSLLMEGKIPAAHALFRLQTVVADDEEAMDLLSQVISSPSIPLLIRAERALTECPAEASWKSEFDEARELASNAKWLAAEEKLTALAAKTEDAPAVWHNLALLRGWIADTAGAIEAWRKYAALDVPLEDAVEAEALAMLLAGDPLGDHCDAFMLVYPVTDAERFQAALSSSARIADIPVKQATTGEDDPPPRASFLVLSAPKLETAEGLTVESVPRVIGQAMLFGRQTDREARLEIVGVTAPSLTQVQSVLETLAEDGLGAPVEQEVISRESASRQLLRRPWQLPRDVTREQIAELTEAQLTQALLEQWPQAKLGTLDDKTPGEAAAEETCRVRVLAAVMVLETWCQIAGQDFDFNRLRTALGLPTLGPIDPEQAPLAEIPLVRLHRVVVEKLSDEALLDVFQRAAVFSIAAALQPIARAVVERPSLAEGEDGRRAIALLAQTGRGSDEAIELIEQGRKATEAAGESSASWDLMELSARILRAEADETMRLIGHLQSQHLNEPGVAQALMQLLVHVGAVRPDGTLVQPPPKEPAAGPAGKDEPDAGELWTPDSQQPPSEKPAIWTPGMD